MADPSIAAESEHDIDQQRNPCKPSENITPFSYCVPAEAAQYEMTVHVLASTVVSAYILMAWTVRNQFLNPRPEKWQKLSERALDLFERFAERERYFIQASY
jgi:hypothetical protein